MATRYKIATVEGIQTLTNKTLTSPKINENVALTATATELNYNVGVTSAIQTQLNAKGAGTVTSASVVSANGFAGTVANATTTPAITISTTVTGILKGNGTAISAAIADTDYLTPTTAASTYVPYTGGTSNVNLGVHNLTVDTTSLFVDSVNHRVGVGTITPTQKFETFGAIMLGNKSNLDFTTEPNPGACTATINAVAGNLNGVYKYKITFSLLTVGTNLGETGIGTISNSVSPVNQKVDLTNIPLGGTGITRRSIYRTKAGGSQYFLVAILGDNTTTTYTDNIADGALGYVGPIGNTTAGVIMIGGFPMMRSDIVGTNTYFGYQAGAGNSDGTSNVYIGHQAAINSNSSAAVFIGYQAGLAVTGEYTGVYVGYRAGVSVTSGIRNIMIGLNSANGVTTGSQNIYIGGEPFATSGSADTNNIVLGWGAYSAGSNQFIVGGSQAGSGVSQGYFGKGVVHTAPAAFTLQSSGASGTNIAGVAFNLAAGKATGNAVGGGINFQTSDAGASGATLQSLTTKFTITAAGSLLAPSTITTVGTTGNQTINKPAGRVNIAAAGTTVTVTNNLVTANSIVIAVAATADATARVTNVVPAAGSFIINTVAVTAETAFNFLVIS